MILLLGLFFLFWLFRLKKLVTCVWNLGFLMDDHYTYQEYLSIGHFGVYKIDLLRFTQVVDQCWLFKYFRFVFLSVALGLKLIGFSLDFFLSFSWLVDWFEIWVLFLLCLICCCFFYWSWYLQDGYSNSIGIEDSGLIPLFL